MSTNASFLIRHIPCTGYICTTVAGVLLPFYRHVCHFWSLLPSYGVLRSLVEPGLDKAGGDEAAAQLTCMGALGLGEGVNELGLELELRAES